MIVHINHKTMIRLMKNVFICKLLNEEGRIGIIDPVEQKGYENMAEVFIYIFTDKFSKYRNIYVHYTQTKGLKKYLSNTGPYTT